MMLTSAELTQMRADVAEMLPDTCNLLTVTRTSDGQGGITDTWGTATTGVACRLDPLRGRESVQGAALQAQYSYILTLPYDTTITNAYRVEIGTAVYDVKAVDQGKSWAVSMRAFVERV